MLALQTPEERHLSPITRLHDELLWMIMLENTELYNEGRLTTARYASQVCRKWRQLMLDSPSIWGRLIDTLELQVTSSSWVQEVLIRFRNAALWIIGPMHAFEPSPMKPGISKSAYRRLMKPDIFLTLVSAEWARIEILDVSDFWDSGENLTVDGHEQAQYWRRLFNQPAPLLKEFTFRYTTQSRRSARAYGVPQAWLLPSPLFNATAPALRKFGV
ncbi:hypothetical protein D9613_006216 [Agrocybe pediades]|uniref:F-box domain-containing protein n=1 Tax=Agrocybe pediades TaxID=84607 RepID=A0A8H4QW26_9AGAR|nr:hypothetical protein D9613_006216 [Agrocybe pediades]